MDEAFRGEVYFCDSPNSGKLKSGWVIGFNSEISPSAPYIITTNESKSHWGAFFEENKGT